MKKILLVSAAYLNGGAYVDAGATVPVGDDKHEITEERAIGIEKGRCGEIFEVAETDEVEEGDGLDAHTVPELKKYAVDEGIDLGTATTKAAIIAAIRAHVA